MAVRTGAQVVTLILKKQFVLAGGETADANDQADTLEALQSHMELLRENGVIWWDDDETPLMASDILAEYMTYYGPVLPFEERAAFKPASDVALMKLKEMAAKSSEGAAIGAEYF